MSKRFVIVEDNKVVNFIMADSFESAEQFAGAGKIVEETEATGQALTNCEWDGEKFIQTFSPPVIIEEEPVIEETND